MGTGKSGRYLNTEGSRKSVSDFALVHSNEGTFKPSYENGKGKNPPRLKGGGHGQDGMDLLDKYHIKYNIVRTYKNGVRIGNIPEHKNDMKRKNIGQSWFPKSWTAKDIKRAGEYVAGLKRNKDISDGKAVYGTYKGVRVGIICTNGKIATIFPDIDQYPHSKKEI